jgi:hypothetical protein
LAAGTPLELNEVGFYELRHSRTAGTGTSVAVNVDAGESDWSTFDPEEMRSALLAVSTGSPGSGANPVMTLAERERRQSGWWYLIVAAFVLLAAETFFSNRGRSGSGGGLWGRWRRGDPEATDGSNTGLAA